jgi:hypothetical protein
MSIPEQKLENLEIASEIVSPTKEEIQLIAPALGIYTCVFSKKPFGEAWSVNGEEISGLLLNPKTAGDLIENLYNPEVSEIKQESFFEEVAEVEKGVLLEHIEKTLADSMTKHLSYEGWFSKKDILQLEKLKETLLNDKNDYCNIQFLYPLTLAFNSYLEMLKTPRSLLLLGYQEGIAFDKDSEVKFMRINTERSVPSNPYYPLLVGRFLSANHPDVEDESGPRELAIKETKYYLNKEEQVELSNAIDPNLYTIFLGEVAKVPDSDKRVNAMFLAGAEYMRILMEPSDTKTDLNHPLDYIPEQVLYMTLPGTAVAAESKRQKGNSRLYQSLSVFWKPFGLEYDEEILSFSKPDGETVLFGVIKRRDN